MAVGRRNALGSLEKFRTKFLYVDMKLITFVYLLGQLPHVLLGQSVVSGKNSCYDSQGRAQRCIPEFVNAAFNLSVEATNTCGVTQVSEFCLQTGVTGVKKSCHICNNTDPRYRHPPEYLTDFNNQNNWTWWQSETMLERRDEWLRPRRQPVNLTLHLGKTFDVTYIRLRFHSMRPESFAIYKQARDGEDWIPFQYYSASCLSTYGINKNEIITREKEDLALCTEEYSELSPLTGGNVPFSTLEGRPSARNYENSPVLQEWVTATSIRIALLRMNTFGDEIFADPRVLKSYFYAIDDLAVGARCKCNGHSNKCDLDRNRNLVCMCEHNTMGPDCSECRPFFNDRPWRRAAENNAYECLPCDCNGMSERCYFDEDLYRQTGHGGHCVDCADNTDGANCERCKENHYRSPATNRCVPCGCDPTGSESLQCNSYGSCACKPGVTGDRCDRCEDNYYDFGIYGCRPCGCTVEGSMNNQPRCNSLTGSCTCKEYVEGQNCDICKPGYFGLDENNPYGCLSCFCYGHSVVCDTATDYYPKHISTDFETGKQRWIAGDRQGNEIDTQYNGILQNLGVSAPPRTDIAYFIAPSRYLGDQRFSYNQFLSFELRIGEEEARPSIIDVVIEGAGQKISAPYYSQGNPTPGLQTQEFKYRLHEHRDYQWYPQLTAEAFLSILSNITAIKIRATYNSEGVGFIDDIKLETARRGFEGETEANWVEQCTCPEGYVGQFCESCAPGYKRDPHYGGPFATCVPCQCNGHSDQCDPDSGRCICQHNTIGDYCDRCASGYYGDARGGTPDDCQPCPCPDQSACIQLAGGEIICTECKEGYGGNLCDICWDGYFGDPKGWYGEARDCTTCDCNGNIDPNAVGNCNSTTGECRKCIYNTAGFYCEKCLPNFYGDALALPKGQCKACACYPPGTINAGVLSCDPVTGDCPCMPNVRGRTCNVCEAGYWNLESGQGCEACACDRTGSINNTCDLRTGQCQCKPGVTGRKCDQCRSFYYGFSETGCTACNCDPEGSLDMQCDDYGYCPCQAGVEGKHCDRCMENKYNITAGCIDCPPCYSLVQERVNIHRGKLRELNNLIINIGNNPSVFNDTEFITRMGKVNDSVNYLLDEARGATKDNGTMGQQLQNLREKIMDVLERTGLITKNIMSATSTAQSSLEDIEKAEMAIDRAEVALNAAENYIDSEGQQALQRAREALNRFGQQSQQMTQIATAAKELSMRQAEEAKMIDTLAKNALNTSREALRLARETLNMPAQIRQEINSLRQKASNAKRLYEQTKYLAEKAHNQSVDAYREALDLYTEAQSVELPKVDVDQLIDEAKRIKNEAAQIKAGSLMLMNQNDELLRDVQSQKIEAEDLLKSGIAHQQRSDELLAEVDAARAKARNAVAMAERTLREANDTLQTLLGFNKLVEESKGKAEEALDKVPEIEALIVEAETRTSEARNALSGAESDATNALNIAEQARATAEDASDEASRIRKEANETKQRAVNLKDQADDLANDVRNTQDQIQNYNLQADNDADQAEQAVEKAVQSKRNAEAAAAKVADALQKINNISSILASLFELDTDEVNRLEIELAAAEQSLADADLDTQFTRLNTANTQVKTWVNQYMIDIKDLEADVENVRQIKDSLPDGCYKNIDIETPPEN